MTDKEQLVQNIGNKMLPMLNHGIGSMFLITAVVLLMKITSFGIVADWPWWCVFLPLFGVPTIFFAYVLLLCLATFVAEAILEVIRDQR